MSDLAAPPCVSPFLGFFDRLSVINLVNRRDRRREVEAQLRRIGIDPTHERVEFFSAIRPSARENWPTIGARGNFLSQYTVLKRARDHKVRNILILEDDCDFKSTLLNFQKELIDALAALRWDLVHLGHMEQTEASQPPHLVPWQAGVYGAHLYALNHSILDRAVRYLELVAGRPADHPLGGPQYYDGALTMFRAQNPDVVTLIASPSLAIQRSSRSDVTPRWLRA